MTDAIGEVSMSSLEDAERALRPLRRVLARGGAERARDDVYFATNCARFVPGVERLALPAPLDEVRDQIVSALAGLAGADGDTRAEHLLDAWRGIQQLDAVLGLPLRQRNLFPRPPRRTVPKRAATAEEATEEEGSASDKGRKGRRRRKGRRDTRRDSKTAAVEVAAEVPEEQEAPATEGGWRWDSQLSEGDGDGEEAGTLWQALTTPPSTMDVLSPVHGAGREIPEGPVAAGGRVVLRVSRIQPGGAINSQIVLQGAGRLQVDWHQPLDAAALARLEVGTKVVVAGTATEAGQVVQGRLATAHQGRAVVPSYDDPGIEALVTRLLPEAAQMEEVLPADVLAMHGLLRLDQAVPRLHERVRDQEARKRMAFDELLALQLGLSHARFEGGAERGIAHTIVHRHVSELEMRSLGLNLADEGQEALEVIKRELRAPNPMRRVLAGSPETGVDEVALHAVLTMVESRSQVMVVGADVPAAVVAFDRWEPLFRAFGVKAVLAGGELQREDREALRKGEIHVVFGPPTVVDLGLEFRRLGFVVAMEQARYGEMPPRLVGGTGPRPDVLVLTRTPLPLSVLLGAYPTFDLTLLASTITPAQGTVWEESAREDAYRALGSAVAEGRSAMLVFPMRRGGTDLLSLREAAAVVATLKEQFVEGAEVALFHGALSSEDRVRAWSDFNRKRVSVLVATTMVEQLAAPPRDLTVVVEHADRADAQRLMGIRSLAGQGGHVHYVLGAEVHEPGRELVTLLAGRMPDASLVDERGAVFEIGDPATGRPDPAFRFVVPSKDAPLMAAVRDTAHAMLRADVDLRQGSGAAVLRLAHIIWGTLFEAVPCPLPTPRAAPSRRRRRRRRRR